jgi:rifampicin phosphotransferase
MDRPFLLPLAACTDSDLVGGKAAGLARLLAAGFRVPPGVCVTTELYHDALKAIGFSVRDRWGAVQQLAHEERRRALAECQAIVQTVPITDATRQIVEQVRRLDQPANTLWAVRSSATDEDAETASFAGVYLTRLGVPLDGIGQAVKDLWASIWDERVVVYHAKSGSTAIPPAMAVVIQPLLEARAAGVAYSVHPVTGRSNQVVVNAVPGLAASLVDGTVTPDQYVLRCDGMPDKITILKRDIATKSTVTRLGWTGVQDEPLSQDVGACSSLSDDTLIELARLTKRVEQALRHPVDVEWAVDERGIWLLQARPVTVVPESVAFTNDECEWSRTNFKETMPELPSPLGLSFLEHVMESFILNPYRRLGCRIPPDVSSARIVQGRPYINVTLMHSLVVQLGGDPAILAEQMGGQQIVDPPQVERLGVWALIRAGCLLMWRIGQAARRAPGWFAAMKQMAVDHSQAQVQRLSLADVKERLADISRQLEAHELTFGIAGGVTQCLQALGLLLPRWLGEGWRSLLNGALQGQAQAISALQIIRLAELVDCASREAKAGLVLREEPWDPASFRTSLQGTGFLRLFDRYLEDYGHRGVGESDIMSPRFADQPDLILDVLRAQLRMPMSHSPTEIAARQEAVRNRALQEIRARFGWRVHRWAIFLWWYRRLCRYFALREANRHHLMYYAGAGRNLLLRAGTLLVEQGVIDQAHDMFFIRLEEQQELLDGARRDWRALIQSRRSERVRNAALAVPDIIRPGADESRPDEDRSGADGILRGMPISTGIVSGPVRIVRSLADWSKVTAGDIIVAPAIDPGMAPLFGIAGGLIVAMGGTLSHGAIIAREYGLPAVANVSRVMSLLQDGELVRMDAGLGEISRASDSVSSSF